MIRTLLAAVLLGAAAPAVGQPLPIPQFGTPGLSDSSSRAATTAWVRSQNFLSSSGDLSQGLVQVPGGTVARTAAARAATTFNVLDYGAKPDGSTDMAPALNAIAGLLTSSGSNVILIPAGNYAIKSPVIFGGVAPILEGQGFTAGPAPASGTMLTISGLGYVPFTFSDTNARGALVRNIAVREAQPAVGPGWQPFGYDYVFKVLNALGEVTFENVYFAGVTRGIYASNSGRVNVRDVMGQFYTAGIEIDDCFDIPRVQHLHAWTYQTSDPNVVAWQEANEDTLILRRVDGIFVDNLFTLGARSAIHLTSGANGVTTKFYVSSLYADFVRYGVWIDANGVTGQIVNATTQHNDQANPQQSLPGSEGLLVNASGVSLQIGNWRSQLAAWSGIDIQQSGNRVDIANVRIENWNGANTGTPAIMVADSGAGPTNTLNLSGQPYTVGGGGSPVINGGNGASARTVLMNLAGASVNEPRFYASASGNPVSASAIGPDSSIDFYLGAKGPTGSVRLRAQNSTVLRLDSPGPGDTDLLLRSGTGAASFIAESASGNADVSVSAKGSGSVRLQSGGVSTLRATSSASGDTGMLVTSNGGAVAITPENVSALADVVIGGQGATGGVRLQGRGQTVLRVDNPGPGDSDLLVRSGTGITSLITESGNANADFALVSKGSGSLRLQSGAQPVLRAVGSAGGDTSGLLTANPGNVTVSAENAANAGDLNLAGVGVSGSVRLQANGGTVLRTDNPAGGNAGLLVRSGIGVMGLIAEGASNRVDVNVTPKGGGHLTIIGTQPNGNGSAASGTYILVASTNSTTAARFTTDGAAPNNANCVNPPSNTASDVFVEIVGIDASSNASALRFRALRYSDAAWCYRSHHSGCQRCHERTAQRDYRQRGGRVIQRWRGYGQRMSSTERHAAQRRRMAMGCAGSNHGGAVVMADDVAQLGISERVARMEERISTLIEKLEEIRHEQKDLADTVARASGGLRVLLMLGGLAGLIGAWRNVVGWIGSLLPHVSNSSA